MEEYQQYLKDRHDSYVDQRKNLDALAFQMGTQHDQWVLTLSGGALGLSVTFLDKIVSHPTEWTKIFLFCSWSALAFSLLAAFYGIHFSHLAISRQLEILDAEYTQFRKTTTEDNAEGTADPAHHKNKFIKKTQRWSWLARTFTVAGIGLFCLFCFFNIRSSLVASDAPIRNEVVISADQDLFKLLQSYKENPNARLIETPENGKVIRPAEQPNNNTSAQTKN